MTITILVGDSLKILRTLESNSIHCVVTSPPYWGLRDYGVDGQMGLEKTPTEFISNMVTLFEEVRRVLRPDGTCFINMGDSYATSGGAPTTDLAPGVPSSWTNRAQDFRTKPTGKLKPKDLCMMPHRLAIALQDAGWWVRQDIVWNKPNPMPESVRDRCTKSHEYIFFLTKSAQYFYDADSIKEQAVGFKDDERNRFDTKDYEVPGQKPQKRISRGVGFGHGSDSLERGRGRVRSAGNVNPAKSQAAYELGDQKHRTKAGLLAYAQKTTSAKGNSKSFRGGGSYTQSSSFKNDLIKTRETRGNVPNVTGLRNKRSVWTMATHSFKEAHFATFPPELPETCTKAGCPIGGTVLDPFFGAGTTGLVADRLQRDCIGIELNPAYAEIARKRIYAESPLLADVRVCA